METNKAENDEDWEYLLNVEKISDKTDDPVAKDYDESCEVFRNGVRFARRGDLDAGVTQIAIAFLLNIRCVKFVEKLPPTMDDEKKSLLLDFDLWVKLAKNEFNGFSAQLMHVLISFVYMCQSRAAIAMLVLDTSLEATSIDKDEEMGLTVQRVKRKHLLRIRSLLYTKIGNYKRASKDLSSALDIDESFTAARQDRAFLWAACRMEDPEIIYEEYLRIISETHRDNHRRKEAFGWLAFFTFEDSSLGTANDAKHYYDEFVKALAREDELYGRNEEHNQFIEMIHSRFSDNEDNFELQRHSIFGGYLLGTTLTGMDQEKLRHACINCNSKEQKDGTIPLLKCARCKLVSYCCKECQVANWNEHKSFCKVMKSRQKAIASVRDEIESSRPMPDTLKTCPSNSEQMPVGSFRLGPSDKLRELGLKGSILDIWQSRSESLKRFEEELAVLYEKHGEGFSDWWGNKVINDKKKILLEVTGSTIPMNEPTAKEISESLGIANLNSQAAFDFNLEHLCGQCTCGETCGHYFDNNLLHIMSDWALNPAQKHNESIQLSISKRDQGVFPDIFEGYFAFARCHFEGNKISNNFAIFKKDAPASVLKNYPKEVFCDASAAYFANCRNLVSLGLLVKLFDEYQLKVRWIHPLNPIERLFGCGSCGKSCQSDSSIRCRTCKVCWFCCNDCKMRSGHGVCPIGSVLPDVVKPRF